MTSAEKAGVISFIRDHIFVDLSAKVHGYPGYNSIELTVTTSAPVEANQKVICIDEKASDGVTFVLDSELLAFDRDHDHLLSFSITPPCEGDGSEGIADNRSYVWSYVLGEDRVNQVLITREMTTAICGTIGNPCVVKISRKPQLIDRTLIRTLEIPPPYELH
jgi:hypothetical protein